MNIFRAMKPEKFYDSLAVMPWEELAGEGIKTALLDFDNTLGPDRATEPEEYSYKCVKMIEQTGIRCCLVSNAKSGRSSKIAEMLGIPCVTFAGKPGTSGVLRAIRLMESAPGECIMVGDQIFTDVIAGNRSGVRTFMVERLHKREAWYIAIKRVPEWIVRAIAHF